MEQQGPHPGWYYDPHGRPDVKRYWDGQQWTDQYQTVAQQPQPGGMSPPDRRYYSLRTIATIYQVVAWLIAGIGGVGVIVAAASASDSGGLVFIVGAIYVFFVVLTMLAFSAFIRLMLSVEESTRTTANAVVAMRDAQVT